MTTGGVSFNNGAQPTASRLTAIQANDNDAFLAHFIAGGGITVFSETGEPVNVQLRWAKTASDNGADKWSLFYMSDAVATGTQQMWIKAGSYTFGSGVMTEMQDGAGNAFPLGGLDIPAMTIGGRDLGTITIVHGAKGITQFADNSGQTTTTALTQNGYGAGEFISVGLNDKGQIVASYTNGQARAIARIQLATFNAPEALRREDGGVFRATAQSGEAILTSGGGIVGGSLEASNTDISEEFTKLIVTQQAYAANTRIVSAADKMLQDALNMIR